MFQSFLSAEDIRQLQAQEASSDKQQKRTPEQIEAIYSHGQNILVSASAGSGKTFVMVERIVDMLSRGVAITDLFISTFTVKAASELKERLEKKLSQQIKATSDDQLRRHLSLQLADVQIADIGTMDAFTQKLLKTYGYLLGIAPQFRILQEESERVLLMNEVFDDLFEDYMARDQIGDFRRLVKNFVGSGKDSRGFRQVVYQLYNFLGSTSHPKDWLAQVFLPPAGGSDSLQADLRQQGLTLVEDLERFFRHHLEAEADLFPKAAYLDHVADLLSYLPAIQLNSSYEAILEVLAQVDALSRASRGRALTNATRKEETKAVKEAYNQGKNALIDRLRTWLDTAQELAFILDHQEGSEAILLGLRDFVRDFENQFFERKRSDGLFEFSDISHLAIQILTDFPQVREHYQNRYVEVMVDEYQDTNHTQESMLELLAKGNNRFMVGDIKQSIYRFRQADPHIFSQKFNLYGENSSAGQLIVLKENFRSQIEVLEATNALFERLMDQDIGELVYDQNHRLVAGAPAQVIRKDQHISQFLLYDTGSDPIDESDQTSLSRGEILLVAKEIIRLHQEEQVPFKDITLLASSRSSYKDILTCFEELGIPLVTDGGKPNYLQSVDVMVMLDTLRTINNPLNDYALVALLKSPMFQFDEDDLARLALQADEGAFYDKLQAGLTQTGDQPQLMTPKLLDKLENFQKHLTKWRQFAKGHSLYELIWLVYQDRLYYDHAGLLKNGEQRQANLYALALRAHQFEQSGFKGLPRFIRMIDKILNNQHDLANVELPAPKNAVSLMTIHKSKGLEFPYVFVLDLNKRFNTDEEKGKLIINRTAGVGIKYLTDIRSEFEETDQPLPPRVQVSLPTLAYLTNKSLLHRANLSEQMRLLYVAMTRAGKKLYLVGKGDREKLEEKFDGQLENNRLPLSQRETIVTFQDWLLAVWSSYGDQSKFPIQVSFVDDGELTPDKIGRLEPELGFDVDNQTDNRQSQEILAALDALDSVDQLNRRYAAAINLPTLRTPSQVKEFYQPVLADEGLAVMEQSRQPLTFDWPSLGQEIKVSPAAVGSAVHELMQRLDLSVQPSLASFEQALQATDAPDAVKQAIDVTKLLTVFDTDLGQLILANRDKLVREAPFAMLETDPVSGEEFVIRGIIDGFLEFEDKIILFDYKTDRYQKVSHLVDRYAQQTALYAKALSRSTGGKPVDKYLILLGGKDIQIVTV